MTNRFAAPVSMDQLAADLAAETQEFTRRLDALGEPAWRTPTPAPGWTVADQVSHLAYFDEAAVRAATDAAGAADRVTGTALDFCLVVTQRRHPADTGLVASGPAAEGWIAIAQAFAGPPGPGRTPGQFR